MDTTTRRDSVSDAMRPRPTYRTIADLRPGDHLCLLYETEEEHRAALIPFLRQGLERSEKVLYIADAHTAEEVLGYLGRTDARPRAPTTHGDAPLRALTSDEAYLRDGILDPTAMTAFLQAETERALAEGYSALRVTDEMTWVLRGLPGADHPKRPGGRLGIPTDRLIECEARLNAFLPGSRCLALCQYDRRRFEPSVLLEVLRTHPVVMVGAELYENFYYVPPRELLSGDHPAAELGYQLRHLEERKQTEEALRESEERYRVLVEQSLQSLIIVQDFRIVFANQAFARLSGYTVEELLSLPPGRVRMLVHPEDQPLVWGRLQARLRGEPVPPHYEFRGIHRDGSVRWLEMFASTVEYHGRPAIQATLLDITERKWDEAALQQSLKEATRSREALLAVDRAAQAVQRAHTPEEVYRTLGAEVVRLGYQAAVLILTEDRQHLVIRHLTFAPELVRQAKELTGVKVQDFALPLTPESPLHRLIFEGEAALPGPINDLMPQVLPEPLRSLAPQLASLLGCGKSILAPLRVGDKPYGLLVVVDADPGESERLAVATLADQAAIALENARLYDQLQAEVAARTEAEAALQEYAEHLGELVEERTRALRQAHEQLMRQERLAVLGQLAGGVGHELRQPLAVIANAVHYLQLTHPDADETTRDYLEMIADEVRNAEEIISELVDLSRARPVRRMEVTAESLIAHALERQPPPEGVEVSLHIAEGLPPLPVDPHQMERVLTNLILNSYQTMPQGGRLTISARADGGPEAPEIAIAVADTGCGISQAHMRRLFDPLFTTKPQGIGLGLAVCKRLVEGHGGHIEVESEEGKGSTFTVHLPLSALE